MEGTPLIPTGYHGAVKAKAPAGVPFAERLSSWAASVILPSLLFGTLAFLIMKGSRDQPDLCWWAVMICIFGSFIAMTLMAARKRWYLVILFALCFAGSVGGVITGNYAYIYYFDYYNQMRSLAVYINIDPSKDHGGAYADAGEVYFKEGSRIETTRAMAIMSKDIYCIAPIVREEAADGAAGGVVKPPPSGSVDWFAVGINCCNAQGEEFTCGGGGNGATARSGLRLLNDDQRHLFKLAADEWNGKFGVPVKHPLFFEWVVDPLFDVKALELSGWAVWHSATQIFVIINLIIATVGSNAVSTMVAKAPKNLKEVDLD